MKYAVRLPNGEYTGTVYGAVTSEITAHHNRYGEELIEVEGLTNTPETINGPGNRARTINHYSPLLPTALQRFTEVSAAQGRLALLQAGVLDALEAWITAQPRATQIEYSSRGTWRRDWPLVAAGATALGLTEAQVDDLFILAATL